MRTCSKGIAWADKAYATDTAHSEVECSNAGICNRDTGICSCFSPFTGAACQRARCPGDCSGHGTCMTIADMSRFYGPDYTQPGTGGDGIGPSYGNWDAQSTTACFCDQGHFGADCSSRMCPKADDPVTVNQDDRSIFIRVGTDHSDSMNGSLAFTFNGHSTRLSTSIFTSTVADSLCEAAFERLENVEDVVCETSAIANGGLQMNLTFSSFPIVPAENNVFYHTGNPDLSAFTCDVSAVYPANLVDCNITDIRNTNIKEYEYCARRGLCDFGTGLCTCLEGYTGAACSISSYTYSASNAMPGMSLLASGLDYIGNVLETISDKRAAADFNFIQCTARDTVVFQVRGDGYIEIAELAITAGGLVIEEGGFEVENGGLAVTEDGASISRSSTSDDVLAVAATSNGFLANVISTTATTADSTTYNHFEATDGSDVVFSVRGDGQTTIVTGGLIISEGDELVSQGDLVLTNGSISAVLGDLTVAGITSSAVVTVDDDIICTGDVTAATGLLTIRSITSSESVTVASGGASITGPMEVVSGGATITAGGLRVKAGGFVIETMGATIDEGDMTLTDGNIAMTLGDLTLTDGDI
ncbi:unnamed protein product, partial [Ectocarpus fasciculatus]